MRHTDEYRTRRRILTTLSGLSFVGVAGIGSAQPNRNNRGQGQRPPEVVNWSTEWRPTDRFDYRAERFQSLYAEVELAEPVGPVVAYFNLPFDTIEIRLMPTGSGTVLSGQSPPIDPIVAQREPTLANIERAAGHGPTLSPHLIQSFSLEGRPIDDEHEEAIVELELTESVGALDVTIALRAGPNWDGPRPSDVTIRVTPTGDNGRQLSGSGGKLPRGSLENVYVWHVVDLSKPRGRYP